LTFNLAPKRPEISFSLNDRVTLFAEGGSALDEFEVRKDNLENVALQYREMHLGAGIQYKFNKLIQSSVSGGYMFNHYLKYKDSLGKVTTKNGGYAEFRVIVDL